MLLQKKDRKKNCRVVSTWALSTKRISEKHFFFGFHKLNIESSVTKKIVSEKHFKWSQTKSKRDQVISSRIKINYLASSFAQLKKKWPKVISKHCHSFNSCSPELSKSINLTECQLTEISLNLVGRKASAEYSHRKFCSNTHWAVVPVANQALLPVEQSAGSSVENQASETPWVPVCYRDCPGSQN